MKNKLFDLYKKLDDGHIDFFYKIELLNNADIQIGIISPDERLDTLSYKMYGSEDDYWVIPFIGNFQDIFFDMPLNEKELSAKAMILTELYAEENGTDIDYNLYNTYKEKLILENEAKAKIKYISQDNLNKLILKIDDLI